MAFSFLVKKNWRKVMEPYAEVACVLKVNSKCHACKMKTMEILGSVCGIYNVNINAEQGLAELEAVVEPNIFLKAISGTGPHAEPKWVKLQHPKMNRSYYPDYYNTHRNGYNYGSTYDPYNHRQALPEYQYPTMEHTYPHYHGSDPYYHGPDMPPARRPFHYY